EKAADADVEKARVSPLDVEPQGQHGVNPYVYDEEQSVVGQSAPVQLDPSCRLVNDPPRPARRAGGRTAPRRRRPAASPVQRRAASGSGSLKPGQPQVRAASSPGSLRSGPPRATRPSRRASPAAAAEAAAPSARTPPRACTRC